ncbi:MAG TPA: hypothetical protein VE994_02010 [Terriglobales bacterium]|nr:hypothetical protein [Terriglobales bacterium]
MKLPVLPAVILIALSLLLSASAQAPAPNNAVSVASMNELNNLLASLQRTSEATAVDIAGLRVDKWKADSSSKRQAQENSTSILRNLQNALPGIISEVRAAPEDIGPTFKLYRNLDALYDVLGTQTELAGAFGSKNEYQALSNDLNNIESTRRALGDRVQALAASRDAELARLRTQMRSAQAAAAATPPKKVIVDDEEPPKKTVKKKKKPAAKPATSETQSQNPPQ